MAVPHPYSSGMSHPDLWIIGHQDLGNTSHELEGMHVQVDPGREMLEEHRFCIGIVARANPYQNGYEDGIEA
jgi:hypothetical protein